MPCPVARQQTIRFCPSVSVELLQLMLGICQQALCLTKLLRVRLPQFFRRTEHEQLSHYNDLQCVNRSETSGPILLSTLRTSLCFTGSTCQESPVPRIKSCPHASPKHPFLYLGTCPIHSEHVLQNGTDCTAKKYAHLTTNKELYARQGFACGVFLGASPLLLL